MKSWFPYEWFDRPEKLDYPGLPEYEKWYSKLKGEYVLTREEWEGCQRLFKENGMQTFADWLRYYNNLDVAPGLEALQKMRNFYTEKGIDILKDAVSVPGVSLHYLLLGAVERNAELYSPEKEVYDMLKEAVVGGPSFIFKRYHDVGVTRIRSHRIAETRLSQPCSEQWLAERKGSFTTKTSTKQRRLLYYRTGSKKETGSGLPK